MTDKITNKSKRVSGSDCHQYVQNLQPFHNSGSNHRHPKGSTLWGKWVTDTNDKPLLYVVYSYGPHFPLYTNWKGVWFANEERVSRTTNNHKSYAHPRKPCVPLSRDQMVDFAFYTSPKPEHLVEAAKMKLLSDDILIAEATKIRIGG